MRAVFLSTTLLLAAGAAHADGFDFEGRVSMGLQSVSANGSTDISPFTRFQGTATYSFDTDFGVEFVLAIEFDASTLPASQPDFLPRHR